MGVLEVLEVEEWRLLRRISRDRRRISGLPEGCFTVKTIAGGRYAYVARRLMGKLRFTYAGLAHTPAAKRMRRKLELSRKYKTALRRDLQDLRRIQRALAPLRAVDRPKIDHELARKLPAPGRRDFGEIGPAVRGSMTLMKGRASIRWVG